MQPSEEIHVGSAQALKKEELMNHVVEGGGAMNRWHVCAGNES